jgi:hypothetical protein
MCNLMCKERRKAWCAMKKKVWTQYILTMVCGYALIVLIDVGSTIVKAFGFAVSKKKVKY